MNLQIRGKVFFKFSMEEITSESFFAFRVKKINDFSVDTLWLTYFRDTEKYNSQ